MSINNIITVGAVGICTGIFNLFLSMSGYVAPEIVEGVTVAATQTPACVSFITFAFVGLEAITGLVMAAMLMFLNVEKDVEWKQAEIRKRHGIVEESTVEE